MSDLLVVFGATGNQGGSVVKYVLNDAELSKRYRIRAVTRQPTSAVAQELQDLGVEVVFGDADDDASLIAALQGVHTVFAMTQTVYDDQLVERETRQGKAIVDAAVRNNAQYFIFSTLVSPTIITKGKFTVESFDVKADLEAYIRRQPMKSAFFAPGGFMETLFRALAPRPAEDGSGDFVVSSLLTPEATVPLIPTALDTGKYVGAILAEPEKYEGKVFCASTTVYSMLEVANVMSARAGKTIRYVQKSEDENLGARTSSGRPDARTDMWRWIQKYGYFGPETEKSVAWAAENARGELTSLDEYLRLNPIQL